MYFAFIFSERIAITFFKEALKLFEHNFFQEIISEKRCYL